MRACCCTRRTEFTRALEQFAIISQAPNWTYVFCSLPAKEMVVCAHIAMDKGYKVDIFNWEKENLIGKSHLGGPRQAASVEYIVVVYKHEDAQAQSLQKHYALLHYQKETVGCRQTTKTFENII